jgi:Bacteriophage probable baseplate hub protein
VDVVALREESARQGAFYVPRFEIKIAGANLPRDVLRDVMQVSYKDSVKELDSFELTVNNWDADKKQFKYVGAETQESLKKNPLHSLFNPCGHDVDLLMGYGSNPLTLMLRGNFTTMEPNFPSSGGSTLSVRGLNILHKLRTSRHTFSWEKLRPSEIAKTFPDLPSDSKEQNQKRFPLPVDTDGNDLNSETQIEYIAQSNQWDIEFLLALARRAGYVIFIKEEEKQGGTVKPRRLYFGPSDGNHPNVRPKTFELKWGLSLIDFKPTLTTANQIKTVKVNGWDRKTKKPIQGSASVEDLKVNGDLRENFESCDEREERVEDAPVFTLDEANKMARDLLKERSRDLVKASGTCIGLPELRAGQLVVIGNLGSRFSSQYFITDTTHTMGDGGYITKFNARREDPDKERK